MRKIEVRFEKDPSLEQIELLIRASERDREVESLIERVSGLQPGTLTITDTNGVVCRIATDDIVSVAVTGKQVQIVTKDESFTVRQPLQNLESELDSAQFVRISRHELVNLSKVRKYDFTLDGMLRLELEGGMETWASRRSIPAIRKRLNDRR